MAKIKTPKKSPRIYRIITERLKKFFRAKPKWLYKLRLQSLVFLMGFLIMTLLILAIDVSFLLQKQNEVNFERLKLNSEIRLWENIVQKYPGKDTYFRLAQFEYRIGDIQKSKYYNDKALYLDPNFAQAQELKAKLNSY